ncbi:hypothetical protein AB3S75_015640 [Citrus x aurantiifolia]
MLFVYADMLRRGPGLKYILSGKVKWVWQSRNCLLINWECFPGLWSSCIVRWDLQLLFLWEPDITILPSREFYDEALEAG